MRFSKRSLLALTIAIPAAANANVFNSAYEATTEALDEWNIFGSNTVQVEYYSNRGDVGASIFPFDGDQAFDDFSLNFNKRVSPYDNWRGQVFGAINGSEYRSVEHGFVLERASLVHEKGDVALPYRWELGDHFGFLSFRTVQRALKGFQLELQPKIGGAEQRHSILLFTGANEQTWSKIDFWNDYYNGASWLVDHDTYGRYSLNFVNNFRDKDSSNVNDRTQWVTSIAGEKVITIVSQNLTLEGELAYFDERQYIKDNGNDTEDVSDKGSFFQVSGRSHIPLTYRFRYERYGENYAPSGAVITPDRRSVEFHAAYRFENRLRLSGRMLRFMDALESADPVETRVFGVNLTGPMLTRWVDGLNGRIDVFKQKTKSEGPNVDRRSQNIRVNLNKPLPWEWNGRFDMFMQWIDDVNDLKTVQFGLSGDRAVKIGPVTGSVSPGIVYRNLDGATDSVEISPTLAAFFSYQNHRLGMNVSWDDFDRVDQDVNNDGEDLNSFRFSTDYRVTFDQHTLGLEFENFHRDPHSGENTNAYKVAAFWRYDLEKPARQQAETVLSVTPMSETSIASASDVDIVNIAPGTPLNEVKPALDGALGSPSSIANAWVYETTLLDEFEQRQRLAVSHEAGMITRATHIIDFDEFADAEVQNVNVETGRVDDIQQTYERVREALIRRYGPPASTFERGDFGVDIQDLINRVDNGEFVRNTEWQTDEGFIRFGMPSRLNGTLRMEVQHARSLPSLSDNAWSLEEIL